MRVRGNREKINNKISNTRATVTVHICMVTVVIVYKYTILHPLMWVFFWPKYVKWRDFCILENYTPTDMDALRILSQSGMSLIDPLDLYLAFALFFLRLLQTHFRFFFLNFFFFSFAPILGSLYPIMSWYPFMGSFTPFMGFCLGSWDFAPYSRVSCSGLATL